MTIPPSIVLMARREIVGTFDKTAYLTRKRAVSDGSGGNRIVSAAEVAIPCRVRTKRGGQVEESGAEKSQDISQIVVAWDTDVRTTDTVRVDGVTYQIIGTNGANSNRVSFVIDVVVASRGKQKS